FVVREFFDEPVWRKDRITAINQHFISAFLDLTLKGDQAKRAFLHATPEKSNDGQWPVKQGESTGARLSEGGNYWKGFPRRSAVACGPGEGLLPARARLSSPFLREVFWTPL